MYRLFETIKISDGKPENIGFHNRRMNGSRKELFGRDDSIDLHDIIIVPGRHSTGKHKCKVVYSEHVHEVIFEPYPERTIANLKVIRCDDIDYSRKYCDRERINALFRQRDRCDEILIVKNGRVTDTSISNIAFYDGAGWVTPRTPLLQGTRRAQLISDGVIDESDIGISDIAHFKKACLINAMLDLGETIIEIKNILY